ncbi:hypothetical protein [Deinococcus sp. UYEF24]
MPNPPKKFNSVRATRLSLLMALSLTVGIGTTFYSPLAHIRPSKSGVQQTVQTAEPRAARLLEASRAVRQPQETASQGTPAVGGTSLPVQEDRSEDTDEEGQTKGASSDHLVQAVQRVPGLARANHLAAAKCLVPQGTPTLARPRSATPTAQSVAPPVRQAIPKIVRRPAAPVIAVTSAS